MGQQTGHQPDPSGADGRFGRAMAILATRAGPKDIETAVTLLRQASQAGLGAATDRLALLTALGMAGPADWDRALDALALAANQGDVGAGQQIQLLAEPDRDPAPALKAGEADRLRRQIAIAERLTPPEAVDLRQGSLIRSYAGFATPAECRWLIARVEPKLVPATVFDKATGRQVEHPERNNRSVCFQISDLDLLSEVFRVRISAATRLPLPFFEPPQIFQYRPGERFKLHADFFDPDNPGHRDEIAERGQRVGTFLVYLNDDYEGGETSFPALGLDWRARTGDGLFFANVDRHGRPDRNMRHAGLPPVNGEKWVFSQWIRDRLPIA